MKKNFALILVLLISLSFSLQAQNLVEWEWDTYKTKFKVPSNFKVSENTSEVFSAGNSAMNLTIYPRTGENLTERVMNNSLSTWARENGVSYSGGPKHMGNLNGYWGVYIDGTTGGSPVSLLLIVDPDYPDISMYIWLTYNNANYNTAVSMLKSFTPN